MRIDKQENKTMIKYNQNETISVIMTVYNEPIEYIKLAINSILDQTYSNIEYIIVVDNPDHFEAIEYIKSIQKIRLIVNEKNIGLPASLNRGIKVSSGNVIARMDSDDISLPQRIEREYEFLRKFDYDLVSSDVIFINETGNAIKKRIRLPRSEKEFKNRIKYECCAVHPTYMFNRKLYEDCGGYKECLRSAQDYEFIYNSSNRGFKIGFINERLLKYRINGNGITSKKKPLQRYITYYIQCAYTKKRGFSEEYIERSINGDISDYAEFTKQVDLYQKEIDNRKALSRIFTVLKYSIKSVYIRHIVYFGFMKRILLFYYNFLPTTEQNR